MISLSRRLLLSLTVLFGSCLIGSAQGPTYPPPSNPGELGEPPPVPMDDATAPDDATATPDVEVQASGPVHEAFAKPSETAPPPGPVVPKKPPQPVPEVPPDQRPEGDNVIWVPGYWAWDSDRNDFLWVSGVWRVPPPGRKWTPGTWQEVDGGWQWSSGFWAPTTAGSLPYLPEPPTSLDNGPSAPAPDDESFYVPGNWVYRSDAYAWRPGYWTPSRLNWIWQPSCYYSTPAGYVCVDGYWDYPLADRGLLFAPVCFNSPLWDTPGWAFQPSYCVEPSLLTSALFAGPGRDHFYFGNYFGPGHRGFLPWYTPWAGNTLSAYYRWSHGRNPGWFSDLRGSYEGRFNGRLPRPAATLREQNRLLASNRTAVGSSLHLVRPLTGIHARAPLARVTPSQAREARAHAERLHQAAELRRVAPGSASVPRLGAVSPSGAGRERWASPGRTAPHPGTHPSIVPPVRHGFATDRPGGTIHTPARPSGPTIHRSVPSGGAPTHRATPAPTHHAPAVRPAPRTYHAPAPTHHAPAYHAPAPAHHAPAYHAPARPPAPAHHAPAYHAPARAPAPARHAPARSAPPARSSGHRR